MAKSGYLSELVLLPELLALQVVLQCHELQLRAVDLRRLLHLHFSIKVRIITLTHFL